jgi:hypothetical protein
MNTRTKVAAAVLVGMGLGWGAALLLQFPRLAAAPADAVDERTPAQKYKNLVPSLRTALRDSEPGIRQHAAQALGYLGRDALPAIMELLRSKNRDQRWRGVSVMMRMRAGEGQDAIPLLLEILNDHNEVTQTRLGAIQAIRDALKPPG